MSKQIVHEMPYDAPVEQVAVMLRDPAFRERVCHVQGVTKVEVTIDAAPVSEGGVAEVTIDQWQPTAGMPSFAKKVVGEETNIVQREQWSSADHGDITVTIPGKPGKMEGTAVLTPTEDGGTLETVELTVTVNIPVVGGKLEVLIADLLLKALEAEHKVGRDYLAS